MSTVTASALIGASPRYRCGIEPTTLAILHEGIARTWQLFALDIFDDHAGAPASPTKRLMCADDDEIIDTLRLAVHLWAGDPTNDISVTVRHRAAELGLVGATLTLHDLAPGDRVDLLTMARLSPGSGVGLILTVAEGSTAAPVIGTMVDVTGWNAEIAPGAAGQTFVPLSDSWRRWGAPDAAS